MILATLAGLALVNAIVAVWFILLSERCQAKLDILEEEIARLRRINNQQAEVIQEREIAMDDAFVGWWVDE